MLTLYFSPGACSTASHMALEETGAAYAEKPTLLPKGEHKTEAYLKINPRGKVPALAIDGKVLTENTAILTYLAKLFPAKNLLPRDPLEEARCISTMAWLSNTVHPSYTHYVRPERFTPDAGAQASVKDTGKNTFWANCQEIDTLLEGQGLDHGKRVFGRRLLRAGVLRLGPARRIADEGSRQLHGVQGAHVKAPRREEGARKRRQRIGEVARVSGRSGRPRVITRGGRFVDPLLDARRSLLPRHQA